MFERKQKIKGTTKLIMMMINNNRLSLFSAGSKHQEDCYCLCSRASIRPLAASWVAVDLIEPACVPAASPMPSIFSPGRRLTNDGRGVTSLRHVSILCQSILLLRSVKDFFPTGFFVFRNTITHEIPIRSKDQKKTGLGLEAALHEQGILRQSIISR